MTSKMMMPVACKSLSILVRMQHTTECCGLTREGEDEDYDYGAEGEEGEEGEEAPEVDEE